MAESTSCPQVQKALSLQKSYWLYCWIYRYLTLNYHNGAWLLVLMYCIVSTAKRGGLNSRVYLYCLCNYGHTTVWWSQIPLYQYVSQQLETLAAAYNQRCFLQWVIEGWTLWQWLTVRGRLTGSLVRAGLGACLPNASSWNCRSCRVTAARAWQDGASTSTY